MPRSLKFHVLGPSSGLLPAVTEHVHFVLNSAWNAKRSVVDVVAAASGRHLALGVDRFNVFDIRSAYYH